jgi:Ala-tRNA(Pro) deacylase
MPVDKMKQFLDGEGVKYVAIQHSPAYTSQEVAASAHIPGRELAKTVMVRIDDRMAMAVLPASRQVDTDMLKDVAGADTVSIAGEDEFKDLFPDCEIGAMPPFGNLYDMKVYVDDALTQDEEIAFNAGSHSELVRMAYKDYERLVQPKVSRFSK